MSILALDVSFSAIGWVVFAKKDLPVKCGVIRTEPPKRRMDVYVASSNIHRATQIVRELRALISEYQITGVVAEMPHGGSQSANASHKMGIAIGVVSAVVEMARLPVEYVQPVQVKLSMCGSRNASKGDVIRAAKRLFGRKIEFPAAARDMEHVADACGAYCACRDTTLVRLLLHHDHDGDLDESLATDASLCSRNMA